VSKEILRRNQVKSATDMKFVRRNMPHLTDDELVEDLGCKPGVKARLRQKPDEPSIYLNINHPSTPQTGNLL